MIDLDRHDCLQTALDEAFARFGDAPCLIEANRDRENARLSYTELRDAAGALAAKLQQRGCRRAAILMSNQSKWHVAACAVFWIGAELVPLDPKLTPPEHAALLEHSGADTLFIEYHLWRQREFDGTAIVVEAPPNADLENGVRFEDEGLPEMPDLVPRSRDDTACIVYSSGTGGRAKGCVMTHGNYLSQCKMLLSQYQFEPGDRYLSILPTNHAIDFMVGFIGPYTCGATVVHLRTLRPEFVRDAFPRYEIAYVALVPMILSNLADGLRAKIKPLLPLIWLNKLLTGRRPKLGLSRVLLRPIHKRFGGKLKAIFVGGAFTDPSVLRFFFGLGIPVANGYGLTEAGTVVTVNTFDDYRPETVGRPLPGTRIRTDGDGVVHVQGPTVMARYHDDPALTAETIVDGWLVTGDVGRIEESGHLTLLGRKKNMIVTAGGKNIYPEDIENAFDGLPVKEYCVFAEHFLWSRPNERLLIVVRPDDREFVDELQKRNRRLPDFKRVHDYLVWDKDFPRTASLKIKRAALGEELGASDPGAMVAL